jgi:hypothetical protein
MSFPSGSRRSVVAQWKTRQGAAVSSDIETSRSLILYADKHRAHDGEVPGACGWHKLATWMKNGG